MTNDDSLQPTGTVWMNEHGVIWLLSKGVLTEGSVRVHIRPIARAGEMGVYLQSIGLEYLGAL